MVNKSFIGLDIGGTKMEAVLVERGKILDSQKIRTPRNKKAFLAALEGLIKGVRGIRGVRGIGIAVAGAIDQKAGRILNSPNMKFLNGVRLREFLENKFKKPVEIENDANCFLLGEMAFGQARGKKNVVALTLGTGVGGAVLAEGKFLHGKHGAAGELGHMIIDRGKSVEDLISSHGFARIGIRDPLKAQNEGFDGNKKARAVYRQMGKFLGVALANYVNIFDPEIIILGGGIANAGPLFLPAALAEVKKYALTSLAGKLPKVVVSRLKHAAALGAATLVTKS